VNIQNVKIVSISIHDIELAKSKENIQLKTEIRKATGTKESDRTLKKKGLSCMMMGIFCHIMAQSSSLC